MESGLNILNDDELYHVCEGMSNEELNRFTLTHKRAYDICQIILNDRMRLRDIKEFINKIKEKVFNDLTVNITFARGIEKFRIEIFLSFKGKKGLSLRLSETILNLNDSILSPYFLNKGWKNLNITHKLGILNYNHESYDEPNFESLEKSLNYLFDKLKREKFSLQKFKYLWTGYTYLNYF